MNAFHQRFYDNLSRLLQADYDSGDRVYDFAYDVAGNRRAELLTGTGITNANRYFGYNLANQLDAEGDTLDGNGDVIPDYTYEYDNNGNLLYKKDTVPTTLETHVWDRANRLLSVGNHSYAYEGNGTRIQKTVSSVVTDYLLDVQPGLTQVLRESDGTNTNHYIHSPRGIHAMNDGSNRSHMLQDGLGSVRAEIAQNVAVNGSQSYAPYGEAFGASGVMSSSYGFTGEQTDANGQVYLRARYYNPSIGVFNALDPFEGSVGRPMSLNGYSWVEGNPVMNIDPSGQQSVAECLRGLSGWARCKALNNGTCENPCLISIRTMIPQATMTPSLFATNTPSAPAPTATVVSGNPCDSNLLPSPAEVIGQTFNYNGSNVPSYGIEAYHWQTAVSGVSLTQYGAANEGIDSIANITREQAYRACCSNGVIQAGDGIYKCTKSKEELTVTNADGTKELCGAKLPDNFSVNPATDFALSPSHCNGHPTVSGKTCAIPGKTGAISELSSVFGKDNIGKFFIYFIPDNGTQSFPLYINDSGGGADFKPNAIDVYVGRLQPGQNATLSADYQRNFSGLTGTACVLARSETKIAPD